MFSLKTVAFSAALLFAPFCGASSADQSCVEVTFPNILNFGEVSMLAVLETMLNCTVSGIAHLDVGSQLYLLQEVFTTVLKRLGMGQLADFIFTMCKSIESFGGVVSPLGNCSGLNATGEISCAKPVVFHLPSALDPGKCIGDSMSYCVGNQANQAQVILQFFGTFNCVFRSLLIKSPIETIIGLLCTVVKSFVGIVSGGSRKTFGSVI